MNCLACCGTVGCVVPRLRVVESANSVQYSVRWIRVLCRTMKRTWRFLDVARQKNGYCYCERILSEGWFALVSPIVCIWGRGGGISYDCG